MASNGKKGKKEKEERETLNIELFKNQIIRLSDRPSRFSSAVNIRYIGKLLNKQNNILVLGIYIDKGAKPEYNEGDVICVSYVELQSLFVFSADVLEVRRASAGENFEIDDTSLGLDVARQYDKYIFIVSSLNEPKQEQRREFFRMNLKVDIYYKIIEPHKMAHITDLDMKFELAQARDAKINADNGTLERRERYAKLTTSDISAGGFKCKDSMRIDAGTFLDCLAVIGNEALPVVALVLESSPDYRYPGIYNMRARFYKISEPVRDRLVRYIFLQQKKMRDVFPDKRL